MRAGRMTLSRPLMRRRGLRCISLRMRFFTGGRVRRVAHDCQQKSVDVYILGLTWRAGYDTQAAWTRKQRRDSLSEGEMRRSSPLYAQAAAQKGN